MVVARLLGAMQWGTYLVEGLDLQQCLRDAVFVFPP
eukprot:SAG31_NODE_4308_length_3369_cov_2.531804_3_plen_36_part_00